MDNVSILGKILANLHLIPEIAQDIEDIKTAIATKGTDAQKAGAVFKVIAADGKKFLQQTFTGMAWVTPADLGLDALYALGDLLDPTA